jgi:hypothetical protein
MLLSSSALPAYLAAAFAKRAARLALAATAPAALFVLPFVYNCVRRHAAVAVLLQRAAPEGSAAPAAAWPAAADPFDATTDDPAAARALDSSLWELTALATHYYAPVAYLARVFLRGPATRQDYDIAGGYASNVYAALIKAELGRTARRAGAGRRAGCGRGHGARRGGRRAGMAMRRRGRDGPGWRAVLRNNTHFDAGLRMTRRFTQVYSFLRMLRMLCMITLIYACYAMNTQ